VPDRDFPFTPTSTAHIRPGDFWAIPLRRGGWFACGRVLRVSGSRVLLTVGLLDWCEPVPPTSESIAGTAVLDVGSAHVKTIAMTGGGLVGHRSLDEDGGLSGLLGPDDPGTLEGEAVWGYLSIEDKAHNAFGRHFAEQPTPATVRPSGLSRH